MGMGLVRVAERAHAIGATTLQIFSDNPTAWRRRAETPPEAEAFRRRLVELSLGPVAIHAAYLVNLAGPDDELFAKSVEMMRHEVAHAPEFGARFVNVHVGSHRGSGRDVGVSRVVDGLAQILDGLPSLADDPDAALVVLENSSGGGDSLGSTLEELAMVLDAAETRGLDGRIRVCLDFGASVGSRVRGLPARSDRRDPGGLREADRPAAARDDPPQRFHFRRSARATIGTRIWATGRSGGPDSLICSATRP